MKRIVLLLSLLCGCTFGAFARESGNLVGFMSTQLGLGSRILFENQLPDKELNGRFYELAHFREAFRVGDIIQVVRRRKVDTLMFDGYSWWNQNGEIADDYRLPARNDIPIRFTRCVDEETRVSMSVEYITQRTTYQRSINTLRPEVEFVNGVRWEYVKDGDSVSVLGCMPINPIVTIPESIAGAKVEHIARDLFLIDQTVRTVKLPKTLKSIGDSNHLKNNYTLERISVDKQNPYLEDDDGLLYTMGKRKLLSVPVNRAVGILPDSLESIGTLAMHNHKYVTAIRLPDSVKDIGSKAFASCMNLRAIYIPDQVTSLKNNTFSWCYKLEEVHLPCGLREIGSQAFMWDRNIREIEIPSKVEKIHYDAFKGCSGLRKIVYHCPYAPHINPFADAAKDCVIFVHRESQGWNTEIPGVWNGIRIEYFN